MNAAEIDRSALRRLLEVVGGDVSELEDLRNDYMEDAPALAHRIGEAAARCDLKALRIAAHTLKSNARDFGAVRLAELCAALERDCAEGGPERPDVVVEDIRRAEEAARQALADLRLDDLGGSQQSA